ncbi:MAG TPA: lycopene cyclase domain-containing protein, partial [Puia sp.]|nr:lycopene cyclase domain-containing protein [Puia sp.]
IPFSCLFTYYCLEMFFHLDWTMKYQSALVWSLVGLFTIAISLHPHKMYPVVTGIMTIDILVFLHFIAKVSWLAKATLTYVALLPGFFLVNGVLTGTGLRAPIVNYDPNQIMNVRVLTIPIEDFVYGYALILLNLYFFHVFRRRSPARAIKQ